MICSPCANQDHEACNAPVSCPCHHRLGVEAKSFPGKPFPAGAWLWEQRKAAILTREELSERSGVSVRTIADLESGRTSKPYLTTLRLLVVALGFPESAGRDLLICYRTGQRPGSWPGSNMDKPTAIDWDRVSLKVTHHS